MRVRRTVVGGSMYKTIHAREPQLVKLPIPLAPIPVISPLVGGSKKNTNSGTTPAANTPAPAQPTSPSSSPSSNGGGASSPGGSTPSTGGNGSPSTGGNGSPAAVPPVVVPGSGTGSGAVSGDTPTPGSSGDSPTTGSGTLPSGVSTVTSSTSGSVLKGAGGVAAATGSDSLGSGTNDPSGAVANAAGVTNASHGNIKNSKGSTLTAGGSSSTASGNNPNNATSVSGAEKGHLSTGGVAAIVVIFLAFFFALLVLFLRRRSRARRNERANTWWFSKKRTSQTYGDGEILVAGSQSARSSFASAATIPLPPPMAEVRQATASSLQAVIDASRFNTEVPDNRFSIGSNNSENSQFLFVNFRSSLQVTPSTGQALSPTQSFAFPKPPPPASDRASAYSRPPSSRATMSRPNSDDSIFSSLPPVPLSPTAAPLLGYDPFASNPFGDNNPFEDSQRAAAPATLKEIIRRPYQRNLEDEVTVSIGEYVHVLTTFDDGWAYVVKVPPTGSGKGDNENVSGGSKGLIPIHCLREPGEDLCAFIGAKRISSYGAGATFTAK